MNSCINSKIEYKKTYQKQKRDFYQEKLREDAGNTLNGKPLNLYHSR